MKNTTNKPTGRRGCPCMRCCKQGSREDHAQIAAALRAAGWSDRKIRANARTRGMSALAPTAVAP